MMGVLVKTAAELAAMGILSLYTAWLLIKIYEFGKMVGSVPIFL